MERLLWLRLWTRANPTRRPRGPSAAFWERSEQCRQVHSAWKVAWSGAAVPWCEKVRGHVHWQSALMQCKGPRRAQGLAGRAEYLTKRPDLMERLNRERLDLGKPCTCRPCRNAERLAEGGPDPEADLMRELAEDEDEDWDEVGAVVECNGPLFVVWVSALRLSPPGCSGNF